MPYGLFLTPIFEYLGFSTSNPHVYIVKHTISDQTPKGVTPLHELLPPPGFENPSVPVDTSKSTPSSSSVAPFPVVPTKTISSSPGSLKSALKFWITRHNILDGGTYGI